MKTHYHSPYNLGDVADEKFWPYVEMNPDSCWDWVGEHQYIHDEKISHTVARFSYLLKYKKLRLRSWIKRECGNGSCVNPEHLKEMPEHTRRSKS